MSSDRTPSADADSLTAELVRRLTSRSDDQRWDDAALGAARYQLGPRLGEGGMGVVFRAHDGVLGRDVALKLLRAEQPASAARFLREARAQARVDHDHVCKVYDVGELAGAPFIAMQLVDGDTLDRVAPELSPEQCARVMRQVADGVHAAHRLGLIHRDVKPQNILVERTASDELRPYVTDFGLVCGGDGSRALTLTRTGQALGTPPYMAPEQVRCESIDRRADVYALGATLYHALTGQPPYSGPTAADVLAEILRGEPPRLRAVRPSLPRPLEAIVLRCLCKHPDDRYGSAHELAQDLQRFLDGEAVLAGRDGAFVRARRAVRRHPLIAAVIATGALVGFATVASLRVMAGRDIDARVSNLLDDARRAAGAAEHDATRAGALHAGMAAAFSAGDRSAGEALWRDEVGARDAAEHSYLDAERSLETAIAVDPTRGEVRARFGEVLLHRALLAERYHRTAARDALVERFALYDPDGALPRSWNEPARLSLTVTPSSVEVALEKYVEDARGDLHREPAGAASPLDARLAPGSYLATLTGAGLASVRYPVALARGETLRVVIDVPPASAVPDGFVYIPPGRFLFGSALDDEIREVLNAPPLHEARTGGYLIAVHEVTTAEFIAFLDAQPGPVHDFRSEPRDPEHAALRRHAPGVWEYHYDFATSAGYTAQSGEPFRYRARRDHAVQDWMQFPIVGISALDAEDYVAWLARTRLPGARLCSELEWERAARGADGREYPHGRRLAANDANFAETYANKVDIGPDEVGLHPASRSPFGLDDMAGNAWEYTRSVIAGDRYIVRGGSFPNGAIHLHSAVRGVITETFRGAHHGLRVCAPAPASVPLH